MTDSRPHRRAGAAGVRLRVMAGERRDRLAGPGVAGHGLAGWAARPWSSPTPLIPLPWRTRLPPWRNLWPSCPTSRFITPRQVETRASRVSRCHGAALRPPGGSASRRSGHVASSARCWNALTPRKCWTTLCSWCRNSPPMPSDTAGHISASVTVDDHPGDRRRRPRLRPALPFKVLTQTEPTGRGMHLVAAMCRPAGAGTVTATTRRWSGPTVAG